MRRLPAEPWKIRGHDEGAATHVNATFHVKRRMVGHD
jgi:hypothetical protein